MNFKRSMAIVAMAMLWTGSQIPGKSRIYDSPCN